MQIPKPVVVGDDLHLEVAGLAGPVTIPYITAQPDLWTEYYVRYISDWFNQNGLKTYCQIGTWDHVRNGVQPHTLEVRDTKGRVCRVEIYATYQALDAYSLIMHRINHWLTDCAVDDAYIPQPTDVGSNPTYGTY